MAKLNNRRIASDPVDHEEAAVAELLAAIAEAQDRAAEAYAFSSGSAYAFAAMTACNKAARLAGVPTRKYKPR
jgi:hypothetical protein